MQNKDNGCALAVLALLSLPLLTAAEYIINGFVLVKLWQWFVIPIFDIRQIAVVEAIGLSIVAGFLTYQFIDNDQANRRTTDEQVISGLVLAFVRPAIIWFTAWIVHLFL